MRTHLDQCDEFELPGVLLSNVTPERPRWLWPPRLPVGKLVLLEGDPDEGKTTLALDWAARVSTGQPMPGSTSWRRPRGVVVLSGEDGLGDTIVPRLLAAGADLRHIITERPDRWPSLDKGGLNHIRRLIRRVRARLVILDPLAAFIPETVNAYSDHRVRRLLAPLAQLAEETGATIVLIRHLVKEQAGMKRSPKYAGGGSIAFGGAARVELLAGRDTRDPTRKVLARVKGNLTPPFPALGYRLVSSPDDPAVAMVEWLGETEHTAEELLAPLLDEAERGAVRVAEEWLADALAKGPHLAEDVVCKAREQGIAERTLKRAKHHLEIVSEKEQGDVAGSWYWVLPPKESVAREEHDGEQERGSAIGGTGKGGQPLRGGTVGTLDPLGTLTSSGDPPRDPHTTAKDAKKAKNSSPREVGPLAPPRSRTRKRKQAGSLSSSLSHDPWPSDVEWPPDDDPWPERDEEPPDEDAPDDDSAASGRGRRAARRVPRRRR